MTNFDIKITSDTVCPWCYVGKKRLEKGIELYKAAHPEDAAIDTFSTSWMPFYLNPDSPKQGVDKASFYVSKFGPQRWQMIQSMLTQAGRGAGIDFKFGGKLGNTRDSHRLIQLGKTKGPASQTKVVEVLFRKYFEEEQDITSRDMLVRAGVDAGLDEAEVRDWLESGKGGSEVDSEVDTARGNDISGVPNFVIQDKWEISGAQDPEVFLNIFEKIRKAGGGGGGAL